MYYSDPALIFEVGNPFHKKMDKIREIPQVLTETEYCACDPEGKCNCTTGDSAKVKRVGVSATIQIHYAKDTCIHDVICDLDSGDWEGDECRFKVSSVNAECPEYHPSLGDFRIAERHLNAQVDEGKLGWDPSTREYIYRERL